MSLCVFVGIIQNYFMHSCTNHGFDCLFGLVSVVEKIMGKVYVRALVCSCGTHTPFHLTVLPSVMSTLPVCTSTSQASRAILATSVTTLLTPRLFIYVRKYITYTHLQKQLYQNVLYEPILHFLQLTSVYTG